jgi:RES domain-containing protein
MVFFPETVATYYRIVQAECARNAMNGEGAWLHGGRWNPPGLHAVYLAESRALAALEIIVHAPREVMSLDWRIIEVEVPDELIQAVSRADLPTGWQALPSSLTARNFGAKWLRARKSLAIRLPSVIIAEEHSLMLNPRHEDVAKFRVSKPKEFRLDPRF